MQAVHAAGGSVATTVLSAKVGSVVPSQTRWTALEEVDDGLLAARAADGDVRAFEVLMRRT